MTGRGKVPRAVLAAGCVSLPFLIATTSAEDAPVPLWRAARDGQVRVSSRSTQGHCAARLAIESATRSSVLIDVNASYLAPVTSHDDIQPLGIGVLETRATKVRVDPGKRVEVGVLTVCMKERARSPHGDDELCLAPNEAPESVAKILHEWGSHPEKDQGNVQSAVWDSKIQTELWGAQGTRLEPATESCGLPSNTTRVSVSRGVVFALDSAGDLFQARPESLWRKIGHSVTDVVADAKGGVRVLARSAPDATGAASTGNDWQVVGWNETRRSWSAALATAHEGKLRWAADDAAILEQDGALVLHTRSRVRRVADASGIVVPLENGVTVFSASEDGRSTRVLELTREDGGGLSIRAPERLALEVSSAASSMGKIFATTRDAKLFLVVPGSKPVEMRAPWDLGPETTKGMPGRPVRAVVGAGGHMLVDTESGFLLRTEGAEPQNIPPPPEGAKITGDPQGTIYCWTGTTLSKTGPGFTGWVPVSFIRYVVQPAAPPVQARR